MCGSIRSEYPVTTSITADDVPGIDSDSIKVILDDTKPWEKATISWKMPPGVEHVSVAIKSHHLQVARNRLHSVYHSKASPYVEIRQEIHKKNFVEFVKLNDESEDYLVEIYSMVAGRRQPLPTTSIFRLGLMAPSNLKVSLDKVSPWAVFHLTWDWPKGAKSFSAYVDSRIIEKDIKDNKLKVNVAHPAKQYHIKLLSLCGTISSRHPAEITISTATISLVQADTVKWEPDSQKPWEKVLMRWDRPPQVEWFKINIRNVYGRTAVTKENYHEIAAESENVDVSIYSGIGDVQSPTALSVKYIMAEMPEIESKSIKVVLDEAEPGKIATISWEMPVGIDFASVDIQPRGNNPLPVRLGKNGKKTEENFVTFKSNGVTSEYNVKIYAEGSTRKQSSPASTTVLMGLTSDDINKILQKEYSSPSTHKKNIMMPMISEDGGSCNISLVEFVKKSVGQVNVIKGGHYSGKTTICHEIDRTISSSKTRVLQIQSKNNKNTYLEDIILLSLNRHGVNLVKYEIQRYVSWMEENDNKITFIIDDFLYSHLDDKTNLSYDIVTRNRFPRSSVFITTHEDDMGKPLFFPTIFHIGAQSVEGIEKYLTDQGKLKLWKAALQHFSDACIRFDHLYHLMKLLKPENKEHLHSAAWVMAKVYTYINRTEKEKGAFIAEVNQCPQASELMGFGKVDVSNLSVHEKFVFSLYTVFFSGRTDALTTLLVNCADTKFLLLCAGFFDSKNTKELFKVLPVNYLSIANSGLTKNLSFLGAKNVSFVPKLGKTFFRNFLETMNKTELVKKFFPNL
uniref:uncharacterized protein LOC120329721 n=1 Tax=Styela clava TaxID=7725 RepID=UPI00193A8EC7|nr:uncharacterized protein LOC120329721 [Styela clava]